MEDMIIRHQTCLPGVLDGIGFDMFALKEPDYIMIVMSTCGQLVEPQGQKDNVRKLCHINGAGDGAIMFKYMKVLAYHFQYCDAVDDHNNTCHDGNG
eukprot:40378-Ditylum_brightwellii.AAC.2